MTLQEKLTAMKTPRTMIALFATRTYDDRPCYSGSVDYQGDEEELKLNSKNFRTLEEVVDDLWKKFNAITGTGKVFTEAVPAQLTYEVPQAFTDEII